MALQLGALRAALLEAGASNEKADKASEEVAAYENCLAAMDGKLTLLTWMVGFELALSLGILWRMVPH